mmetsp:Transcript_23804/g.52185  ORF Transcript_23804/g.52185 Transcript_23804/m.52185 type:complete len:85 (+) Transcript_23804:92-346(+)
MHVGSTLKRTIQTPLLPSFVCLVVLRLGLLVLVLGSPSELLHVAACTASTPTRSSLTIAWDVAAAAAPAPCPGSAHPGSGTTVP